MGSGSLTTTGALNLSGSGRASFQIVSVGRTPTFEMDISHFSQSSLVWELQIYKNNSQQLEVGTYNLGPPSGSSTDPSAGLIYYTGDAANPTIRSFNSTSGQLVITTSSPSEVLGTFTFAATEFGGTNSITVNGSFDACAAACE
jgi:hypothetical protein